MTATEFWTAICQRILGFIAVPLFIMIFFGKAFGQNAPNWAVLLMVGLILAFWVWWVISFVRTWKVLSELRRKTKAG